MPKIVGKVKGGYIVTGFDLSIADDMSLSNNESIEVNVQVIDKRLISDSQRKFIFALCKEFSDYTGDSSDWWRVRLQTYNALVNGTDAISLSKCSMAYANQLITTIISYAAEYEIPIQKETLNSYEYAFSDKQSYMLAMKRTCAICGKRNAELHHVNPIGMGADRKTMSHIGQKVISLCWEHHREAHTRANFMDYYHLTPFVVDEKMNDFIKTGNVKVFKKE